MHKGSSATSRTFDPRPRKQVARETKGCKHVPTIMILVRLLWQVVLTPQIDPG